MGDTNNDLLRELSLWKKKAEELEIRLNDQREEFEEFSASSKELEMELEAQLSQSDKKNKELLNLLDKTKLEAATLQKQFDLKNEEIHHLQEDCLRQKKDIDENHLLIRQLEQRNDDLERKVRISLTSLKEFENRLNDTIEKNVFLQSEKEELMEAAQRWRDESRDLSQELEVQRNRAFPSVTSISPELPPRSCSSSYGSSNIATQTDPNSAETPIPSSKPVSGNNSLDVNFSSKNGVHLTSSSGQMTPSLRINALNGIGDLMRAVGALESRLAFIMNSQYQQQQQRLPFQSSAAKVSAGTDVSGNMHSTARGGALSGGPGTSNHSATSPTVPVARRSTITATSPQS